MVGAIKGGLMNPSILISIRDPFSNPIHVQIEKGKLEHVIYFEFDDWDKEHDGQLVISEEDAVLISLFVKKYQDKEKEFDLYVNCEAGQSRSAGVAAAIAKYLFDDDEIFFRMKHPNMLCYRKVLNALMEK